MLHLQLTNATIRCKFIKVNEDYIWIGADGRRLAMFEGVFDVPEGISFNSYLLKDDKTVLFDTADSAVARQFRENLLHELGGSYLEKPYLYDDRKRFLGSCCRPWHEQDP